MARHVPTTHLRTLEARDGRRCVITATEGERLIPQHRQGGMGGRPDKHRLPNLLWLDSILNGHIESDATWQASAKAWGVKVPIWVTDVTRVPVFFRHEHAWFALDGIGRMEISALDALDRMLDVYGDEYLTWKAIADDSERAGAIWRRGL